MDDAELAKACNSTSKVLALDLGYARNGDSQDEEQVDDKFEASFEAYSQSSDENESACKVLYDRIKADIKSVEFPMNEPKNEKCLAQSGNELLVQQLLRLSRYIGK